MTRRQAYALALASAIAYAVSLPISDALLSDIESLPLAGLFPLGAASVSWAIVLFERLSGRTRADAAAVPIQRVDIPFLVIIILIGGVLSPILLLVGLSRTDAGTGSLMLSTEVPFTALLAAFLFRERLGRRVWLGALVVACVGALLSARGNGGFGLSLGAIAVAGAALGWALDNNVSGKLAQRDVFALVRIKSTCAGVITTLIALSLGKDYPAAGLVAGAVAIGALSYGISLILLYSSMRGIGAARAATLFGTAPFWGAAFSAIAFADSRSWVLLPAAIGMAFGVWVITAERKTS
ncbi:MAG: DMT family transporter [Chloroflexi bacterium]|nr:DMT family transporter [Chloroflexota bacterium]